MNYKVNLPTPMPLSNLKTYISNKVTLLPFFLFFIFTTTTFAQTTVPFTSSTTWTCPAGVTSIQVKAYGAGGGGGYGGGSNKYGGGGGGGGGYSQNLTVSVTPTTIYNITVGTGGSSSTASGTNGGNGTATTATFGAVTITANGGVGGQTYTNGGVGGAGGTGSTFNGGTGGTGTTSGSGGGGGCAGPTSIGGNGAIPTAGLSGGANAGAGGAGSTANGANGTIGANYGGGGGGGTRTSNGAAGANGYLEISYAPPSPCLSATNLPCATTNLAGTTVGSPNVAHGTPCSISNYGKWYTFVGNGQLTTISSTATFDHEMSISSGSCGSFTSLACLDSAVSNGTETYSFTATTGVSYYVYIAHYASGDTTTGTFTISRTCTAPIANDNCAGAVSIPVNPTRTCTSTVAGTILGATDSGVASSGCGGTDDDDVWYSFVATSSTHHIELLSVAGSTTDLYHAVYSGTCGSLGAAILCSDPNTSMVTGLTPGNTYYLQIYSWGSTPGQNTTFNICISTDPPCTTPGSQATGFTAGTISTNSFPATFSGTANSYLVIRSTSATPPSQPVNGVIYTGANIGTLGAGLTLVQNGTSTSIAGTGLTGNTRYYYYIYAYNNTSCSGGPLYNASGPLTGNAVTCPSTPSPVTTASTLTSINFSWPSSLGGGINAVTYQLQVTTDAGFTANVAGSPFTINHPTTTQNITGLTSNTTYYYRIRANNGCWSTYTTGSATTGYCAFTSSNSTYWISNFSTTGGSTNINRTSTYTAGGYANYSGSDIVTQITGQSFNFSTTMSSGTHGINIYVDWNNDLDFDDTAELVYASGAYVGATTGTITIPGGTIVGNHRMRVVANYFEESPSPCGADTYTEAEDYTINVVAPAACAGTPSAGTATVTPNTGWPGSTYIVTASGYSVASNLTFQWQSSSDAGATWTNAGALTSSYANYTATAPASGVILWRLRVTCTNSAQTASSTTATFTTMAVSDVETGCPNVVSGGLGLNGSDHAAINCSASSTCVDLEATYLDLGETTDYIVEPIAYNPPFAFTGLANPIVLGTDDYWSSQVVDLPFDFCYFGNTYDQVLPGPNGALTFNTSLAGTYAGYSFANNLPSTVGALFNNTIYGVYHDINSTYGGQFGWELVTLPTGCKALVVAYNNVPMFSNNAILYSGMIVLYENSNIIEIYVKEKKIDNYNVNPWNGGNAIIGLQNSDGTLAVVPPGRNGLDANWEATGEAWRFVPNGNSIASIKWYEGVGTTGSVIGTTPTINVCPTSTTTYTAEITYTLCDGRTIKESDQTTVTINGAKVWNGSVSTNWNIANNWTPTGVPTALDCVVVPDTTNDPIIGGTNYSGLGLNLAVNTNASLNITATNTLKITDVINVNATGTIVVQDDASIVQINNVPNIGNIQYRRAASIRRQDYVYWSSPVASFASNAVSPGTSLGFQYKWTPTIASNTGEFGNWAFANETMVLGKGYCLRAPDSYSLTTPTGYTANFVGVPNNGNISTPISRGNYNTAGTYSTGVSTTLGTRDDDNWNLVGNPYPSAINAINFLTLNPNIAGFVNIWTHGSLPSNAIADPFYNNYAYNYTPTDYITYNSTGTSTPAGFDGFIGGGQGFFISMLHGGATTQNLNFDNTLRRDVGTGNTYSNTQFFKTSNQNSNIDELERHRIWFDLVTPSGTSARSLLGYVENATDQNDRLFDAFSNEKLSFNIFSLIDDEQMLIQGRKLPFDSNDKVNIGVSIPQDGLYKIALGSVDGLFLNTNQNIYLEDKLLNVIFSLKEAPYSFMSNKGVIKDRFILRYTKSDNITELTNQLTVYDNNVLTVESGKLKIKDIVIFDTLGKLLLNKNNVNDNDYQITNLNRTNSMLIVKVTLEDNSEEVRKVIY
jgi:hypothetical protein